MKCPPCKGTGNSPSTPNRACLCCKGKKEITQKHFDTLQRISGDLQVKLAGK
jgi:DnaJ-class molecular chaperone